MLCVSLTFSYVRDQCDLRGLILILPTTNSALEFNQTFKFLIIGLIVCPSKGYLKTMSLTLAISFLTDAYRAVISGHRRFHFKVEKT